jgi:hypothetical protein
MNYLSPALATGLQKMPTYHGPLARWQADMPKLRVGSKFTLPALASFARPGSSLENQRGQYEPVKLIIENGTGKRILLSWRDQEREVVLPRGTEFQVMAIEDRIMPEYIPGANRKQRVFTLRQLNTVEITTKALAR